MKVPVVLVIDDNPITRKMVRVALKQEGYETVESGHQDVGDDSIRLELMRDAEGFLAIGRCSRFEAEDPEPRG